MALTNGYLQLFLGILLLITMGGNIWSGARKARSVRVFYGLMGADITMLFTGSIDNFLIYATADEPGKYEWLEGLLSGLSDASYFCVLGLFILYLDACGRDDKRPIGVLAHIGMAVSIIYAIFWMVSDFNGAIYVQDAENIFRGTLYYVGQLGGYITGILSIILLLVHWKAYVRNERIGFLIFIFIPLIGSIFRGLLPGLIAMPVLVTISVFIIQCFVQFNREMVIERQKAEIAGMRADILMSRMKPHFIYNVLNTIYALCDISADRAKEAISMFSKYLRKSMVDIDSNTLISFENEMEHVENYLNIEKLRFGKKLTVEYDIKESDFLIPPLSVQTVVENAVRHGIEKKPGGGTVTISTEADEDAYLVTVTDTGVGFDTSEISLEHMSSEKDGRKHVGLFSSAYRLEHQCNAVYDIKSAPGLGTTVTIRIPKGEQEEL